MLYRATRSLFSTAIPCGCRAARRQRPGGLDRGARRAVAHPHGVLRRRRQLPVRAVRPRRLARSRSPPHPHNRRDTRDRARLFPLAGRSPSLPSSGARTGSSRASRRSPGPQLQPPATPEPDQEARHFALPWLNSGEWSRHVVTPLVTRGEDAARRPHRHARRHRGPQRAQTDTPV